MVGVWHYDGSSAVRHEAELHPQEGGFALTFEGGYVDAVSDHVVAWDDLTSRGMRGKAAVFGHKRQAGWQIGFPDGVPADIKALMPRQARYGSWIDRFGLWRMAAVFTVVSVALVALFLKAPEWIAPNIPMSVEVNMGNAMVGKLDGKFCKGTGGEDALKALVARMEPGDKALSVHVVRADMVNAVTLPGGTILIFDGLLKTARSPDEIAGVLGHEIGHVRHRDVMQALVRQFGLSILLGGMSNDMGGNLNMLLNASYSRAAEAAADDYSIEVLRRAVINPKDTAGLFERLSQGEGGVGRLSAALAYVASHPVSSGRAARFTKSANAKLSYAQSLSPDQWRALVNICTSDPQHQRDNPFDPFS
jgi:beta-barrel assembly-enhancing protease